jgi:hypothetical protein
MQTATVKPEQGSGFIKIQKDWFGHTASRLPGDLARY